MTLRVWGVGAGRRIHRLRGAEREGICRCYAAGFRTEKGDRNERMLWLLGAGKGRNRFPPPRALRRNAALPAPQLGDF